jgi:hypothetical protein
LVDDDKAVGPYRIDTSLLEDTDSPLSNAFAAAYIRPRPLPPETDVTHASFRRNVECSPNPPDSGDCGARAEIEAVLLEGRDVLLLPSADFWLTYIQGVFQASEAADLDPQSERGVPTDFVGVTVGLSSLFGSQVYLERLEEVLFDDVRAVCRQTSPPHELGHQFGIDDRLDSHGIMAQSCEGMRRYYAAESLRRIRQNGVRP